MARAAYNRIPDKFLARNQRAVVAAGEEHGLAEFSPSEVDDILYRYVMICIAIYLSTYLSIYLSTYLSIYRSIELSIYIS